MHEAAIAGRAPVRRGPHRAHARRPSPDSQETQRQLIGTYQVGDPCYSHRSRLSVDSFAMSEPATPPPHPLGAKPRGSSRARSTKAGSSARPRSGSRPGWPTRACTRRCSPARPRASVARRATSSASRATSSSRSPTCAATAAPTARSRSSPTIRPRRPTRSRRSRARWPARCARAAPRRCSAWATSPRSPTRATASGSPRGPRRRPRSISSQACELAFAGGILPHSNAGILSADEMEKLRKSNASLGLMLESTSQRLREKGGAHYYCPDKDPAVRLRMHARGGRAADPVHERDPARDRRERRRARRHAARDPRRSTTATATSRK